MLRRGFVSGGALVEVVGVCPSFSLVSRVGIHLGRLWSALFAILNGWIASLCDDVMISRSPRSRGDDFPTRPLFSPNYSFFSRVPLSVIMVWGGVMDCQMMLVGIICCCSWLLCVVVLGVFRCTIGLFLSLSIAYSFACRAFPVTCSHGIYDAWPWHSAPV